MAGQKNIYRIARTMLLALVALLAVGAVGSMFLGSRAVSQAKASAVDQARTIVENSLPLTLAPGDVSAPATDSKADLITAKITPVLLDPSPWDDVAIWSLDGQIVYSTDRSLIGQRPEEARTKVRDATESGTVSSEQSGGMFSVLIPLRFRSDGPINAAIQLARPDDVIAAAGRPWRYNAILMTIGLIITLARALPGHATHGDVHGERELLELHEGAGRADAGRFLATSARAAVARPPRGGRRPQEGRRARDRRRGASQRHPGSIPQDVGRAPCHPADAPGASRRERPRPGDGNTAAEGRGPGPSGRRSAEGHEHRARQARSPHRGASEGEGRQERHGRPRDRSQGSPGRARSDRAPRGAGRRPDRALRDPPRAGRAEGAGRSGPGAPGRSGQRTRRGAPRSGGRGVGAERARPCRVRARRRPQRAPGIANGGAEGQRLRRGASSRARRAGQPQGVASRRAGRA